LRKAVEKAWEQLTGIYLPKIATRSGPSFVSSFVENLDDELRRAASNVTRSSSAGSPWKTIAKSSGEFVDQSSNLGFVKSRLLKWLGDQSIYDDWYFEHTNKLFERLDSGVDLSCDLYTYAPYIQPQTFGFWHTEMAKRTVSDGLFDEVRIFIKNEPTKEERLAQQRERIIASVSIVDQLVERVFLQNFFDWEMQQTASELPSILNADMSTDVSCRQLYDRMHDAYLSAKVTEPDLKKYNTDVSTFDWSQHAEDFLHWATFVVKLFKCDLDRETNDVALELMKAGNLPAELAMPIARQSRQGLYAYLPKVRNYLYLKYVRIFATSTGRLLTSHKPITLSGGFDTSHGNSNRRTALAFAVGAKVSFDTGDDGEECNVLNEDEIRKGYEKLGVKVKFGVDGEYCGRQLKVGALLRPDKTFYKLVSSKHDAESIFQSLWELRHWRPLKEEFAKYYTWVSENKPDYLGTLTGALKAMAVHAEEVYGKQ
jgi:hypothetical protein